MPNTFFQGEAKIFQGNTILVAGLIISNDFFVFSQLVSIALNFFLPRLPYRRSGVSVWEASLVQVAYKNASEVPFHSIL